MRILIFLFVVLVLLWLLRGGSQRSKSTRRSDESENRPDDAADRPQPMLRCMECGLHLPRDEALPGRGGVFCGAAHRSSYEQAHPES